MTIFKVGDKVRCINVKGFTSQHISSLQGGGWKLGKVFKIVRISNNKGREPGNSLNMAIYWDDCEGVYEHALELAVPVQVAVYGIVKFCKAHYK